MWLALGIKTHKAKSLAQSVAHWPGGSSDTPSVLHSLRIFLNVFICFGQDNHSWKISAIKSKSFFFFLLWRRDHNFSSHFISLFFNQPVLHISGNKTTMALGTVFCILISFLLTCLLGSVINRSPIPGGGSSTTIVWEKQKDVVQKTLKNEPVGKCTLASATTLHLQVRDVKQDQRKLTKTRFLRWHLSWLSVSRLI